MSSSYNTERAIEKLIGELTDHIAELENCLEAIRFINDSSELENIRERVKQTKIRAKGWM